MHRERRKGIRFSVGPRRRNTIKGRKWLGGDNLSQIGISRSTATSFWLLSSSPVVNRRGKDEAARLLFFYSCQ